MKFNLRVYFFIRSGEISCSMKGTPGYIRGCKVRLPATACYWEFKVREKIEAAFNSTVKRINPISRATYKEEGNGDGDEQTGKL